MGVRKITMFVQPWVVRRLLSAMLYKRMRRVVVFSFVGSWAWETSGKTGLWVESKNTWIVIVIVLINIYQFVLQFLSL